MKILHIATSDVEGGAARSAYRHHEALRQCGIDSSMYVGIKQSTDRTVVEPRSKVTKLWWRLAFYLDQWPRRFLRSDNPLLSPGWLPSRTIVNALRLRPDVVNLQWICGGFVNPGSLARLENIPTVWTMHDMWAFCGMEHYAEDLRWREGYTDKNRPVHESGWDLNRWTWNRKRNAWKCPMQIVTPSRWLEDCVRRSALMRDWPVMTIPGGIDTDTWRPADKLQARQLLGLSNDVCLVACGAMGGHDVRKGIDLLFGAFAHLRLRMPEVELVMFGGSRPEKVTDLGFKVRYIGKLNDDLSLRILYSAVDAVVLPSRQDNLPNVGLEALACGTPVIAFDTGGLPDIVIHQQTGWLAKAFDIEDLASGIEWVVSEKQRLGNLGLNARAQAMKRFSYPVVAAQYSELYKSIIARMANDSHRAQSN